mgnify:CR=1 FL=1
MVRVGERRAGFVDGEVMEDVERCEMLTRDERCRVCYPNMKQTSAAFQDF